ncbi:MAG TPA: 4Fe-4S dicluster domain-containing protein [bacterium]
MPEFLTRKDRKNTENFNKIGEDIILGEVSINHETCSGCGLCIPVCVVKALEIVDKKARMVTDLPFCFSCGDCVAICPENSINITKFFHLKRSFRFLDRGQPEPPRRF